jgi:hypothetical protein
MPDNGKLWSFGDVSIPRDTLERSSCIKKQHGRVVTAETRTTITQYQKGWEIMIGREPLMVRKTVCVHKPNWFGRVILNKVPT